MKPTTLGSIAAAVLTCMAWPGCADNGPRVASDPPQGFLARLGSGVRDGVVGIFSPSSPRADRRGAADSTGAVPPSRGTVYACRRGQTLLVDLNVRNVPDHARMIATGLKLSDGTAVAPKTVLFLTIPPEYPSRVPRVDFDFAEGRSGGPAPAAAAPLCLRITYQLEGRAASVAGASFALVLGQPDDQAEREFGISSAVPVRQGRPAAAGIIRLGAGKRASGGPAVEPALMPSSDAAPSCPIVRFRFDEALATKSARPDDTMVWIIPALESMTEASPRRATVAVAPTR